MNVVLPPVRVLQQGEMLIEQGEPAVEAYLIMSGKAEVFLSKGGKDVRLAEVGEGEFVGETALFKGSDYGANVRAVGELSVQPITPAILDDKIKNCDPMLRALIRMMMVRLRRANEAVAG